MQGGFVVGFFFVPSYFALFGGLTYISVVGFFDSVMPLLLGKDVEQWPQLPVTIFAVALVIFFTGFYAYLSYKMFRWMERPDGSRNEYGLAIQNSFDYAKTWLIAWVVLGLSVGVVELGFRFVFDSNDLEGVIFNSITVHSIANLQRTLVSVVIVGAALVVSYLIGRSIRKKLPYRWFYRIGRP